MKVIEFHFKCHWNLFPGVQLTICQHLVQVMACWQIGTKPLPEPGLTSSLHDDVIKWKHFPRNWPFVRGIHRSPVNSPHKGQWRGALMFSLICVWINDWVNNREAGDLRRYRAHSDVIVMDTYIYVALDEDEWSISHKTCTHLCSGMFDVRCCVVLC